jgi:hypothetical protein
MHVNLVRYSFVIPSVNNRSAQSRIPSWTTKPAIRVMRCFPWGTPRLTQMLERTSMRQSRRCWRSSTLRDGIRWWRGAAAVASAQVEVKQTEARLGEEAATGLAIVAADRLLSYGRATKSKILMELPDDGANRRQEPEAGVFVWRVRADGVEAVFNSNGGSCQEDPVLRHNPLDAAYSACRSSRTPCG